MQDYAGLMEPCPQSAIIIPNLSSRFTAVDTRVVYPIVHPAIGFCAMCDLLVHLYTHSTVSISLFFFFFCPNVSMSQTVAS